MKKIFTMGAILAVATLIALSCKKSSNSSNNSTNSTAGTTTGGSTTGGTTGANFGGMFTVTDIFNDLTLSSGSKDSTGSGTAQPTNTVGIGTVTLNTYTLGSVYGQYSTTGSSTVALPPFSGKPTWGVTGGGGYGAFTFTTTKAVPHVEDLHIMVSTFSKSTNLVITHPTIVADTIKYSLTDDNGNKILKSVVGSSSGYTFTPTMMSSFVVSSNGVLQILGTNLEYSVQGGKNILFVNSAEYNRDGLTINP